MISHAVGLSLSLFFVYIASPGSNLFSWHPTCMALGFLFLAVEGVLLYSPESIMHVPNLRPWKVTFHWMAMGLNLALTQAGFAAIYLHKDSKGRPHFASWHSWIGLATVITVTLLSVVGTCIKLGAFGPKNVGEMKYYHGMAGCFAVLLGMTSVALGMLSVWFGQKVTGHLWALCMGAVVYLMLVVFTHMLWTTSQRKPQQRAIASR